MKARKILEELVKAWMLYDIMDDNEPKDDNEPEDGKFLTNIAVDTFLYLGEHGKILVNGGCGEKQLHGDLIERKAAGLSDFEIALCDGDYKEALKMLLSKIESAPTIIPSNKVN